jgi:hypothetical protein
MPKFKVDLQDTRYIEVTIEAATEDEARDRAPSAYNCHEVDGNEYDGQIDVIAIEEVA